MSKKSKQKRAQQKAESMESAAASSASTGGAAGTIDQRKHPRVSLDVLVQVRSESVDQFIQVHAKNLSVGGMFIATAQPRPVGTSIFFQFTVKDGGTLIEGLGKVVHASPHGIGVEFVSVLEPSASIIRALVDERLRSPAA